LATEWKVRAEGKLYTFNLRKGVKFHNGQEMTAEDVKFSMDYTMNPKNGAFGFSRLALVDRVDAVDKYTMNIHLKSSSVAFLSSLTDIKSFSVVPKGSLAEGVKNPSEFPPGTGPFKFVEWQPNRRIVLRRHDEYWGQKPFLDTVILQPIKDDAVRFVALQAGDIDLMENTPFTWAKQIADGKVKGIKFAMANFGGYGRIEFNVTAPPFDNRKLRQAVAHAINREEILNAAYFGFGIPTPQNYPKDHALYHEGVPTPEYNLEKARALVKESGYQGQPIEILIDQEEETRTAAVTIQSQLKKIGVNIKVNVLDYTAFTTLERRGDFAFTYGGGGSPKTDPSDTYGPQLRCESDLKKRRSNTSGYCDKEMDALLERSQTELDPVKRKELFKRIETKVARDLPILHIGFVPDFLTFRDYVKGFIPDHDGSLEWWGGGLSTVWLDK
jgi:peptide/nickel transport system substrate-binding protein